MRRSSDAPTSSTTPAYDALGEDGCARLRSVARPFSQAVLDAGVLVFNVQTLPDDAQ